MNCSVSHCTENRSFPVTPCSTLDKTESCPVPFGWSLIFHLTVYLQGALLLCVFTQLTRFASNFKTGTFRPLYLVKGDSMFWRTWPWGNLWYLTVKWNKLPASSNWTDTTTPAVCVKGQVFSGSFIFFFFFMWCGNFLVLWWKLQGKNLKWK